MNIKTLPNRCLVVNRYQYLRPKKKEVINDPTLRCIYYNRPTKSLIKNLRLQK